MLDKIDLSNLEDWWYLVNKILNNRELSSENKKDWTNICKYKNELETYFFIMNYNLNLDEKNNFYYIEEIIENEHRESLSKKHAMSFWVTLFLVLLREFLYKKEDEDLLNTFYSITTDEIKEKLSFYLNEKYENDEKKVLTEIDVIIKKTIDLWMISKIKGTTSYKINKLLKAKLSVTKMEELLVKLNESLDIEK